jgi:hypothetical protein
MDEITAIDRAHRAERLLKDPLLVEAFDKVRAAILAAFEASPARDAEGREHLFQRLKALNDAKGYLEQAARNAKVVLHLQEEKRRFKLFR